MQVTEVTITFENGTKRVYQLRGERKLGERINNLWCSAAISDNGKPFSIKTKVLA